MTQTAAAFCLMLFVVLCFLIVELANPRTPPEKHTHASSVHEWTVQGTQTDSFSRIHFRAEVIAKEPARTRQD